MIESHENRVQICCDCCPASYPNTYAREDFAVMVADAKAAGWLVRKALPSKGITQDTADLFGTAPRIAGPKEQQAYVHTCPACRQHDQERGKLV